MLCPGVAFVRAERMPPKGTTGFFQGPSDLAVEVVSPSERPADVSTKGGKYLDHGTSLDWCVYPDEQLVVVHAIDEPPMVLREVPGIGNDRRLVRLSEVQADRRPRD